MGLVINSTAQTTQQIYLFQSSTGFAFTNQGTSPITINFDADVASGGAVTVLPGQAVAGSCTALHYISTNGIQAFQINVTAQTAQTTKNGPHFGYNIAGGLANYKSKLANYPSQLVQIHCIGDSLTWGANASSQSTTSWPGLLRSYLQNRYGNGGIGYVDVQITYAGVHSVSWPGGWTFDNAGTHAGGFDGHTVSTTSGAIVVGPTITITGVTKLTIGYVKSASGGTAVVQLDGVTQGNINCNGSGGGEFVLSGLTTASHTVTITPNGNGLITLGGNWVDSGVTNGIRVHNAGCPGITSTQMTQTGLAGSLWDNHPADLVILELGANDVHNAQPNQFSFVTTFTSNMQQMISYWQGKGASVLLLPWLRPQDGWTTLWPEIVNAMYSLCDQYNCALVDLYQATSQSYEIAQYLNLLGSNVNGTAGSNQVHPGDFGYQFVERIIEPHLIL